MVNLLGVCKAVREQFPIPASSAEVSKLVLSILNNQEPDDNLKQSIIKVLTREWKRRGWVWDTYAAALPSDDEEILFEDGSVTIVRRLENEPKSKSISITYTNKDFHPSIIWF